MVLHSRIVPCYVAGMCCQKAEGLPTVNSAALRLARMTCLRPALRVVSVMFIDDGSTSLTRNTIARLPAGHRKARKAYALMRAKVLVLDAFVSA